MTDVTPEQDQPRRSLLPRTFVAGRLVVVAVTLAIIALICAGFAGQGPGHALHGAATEPAIHWIDGQPIVSGQKRHGHRDRRRHKRHHSKRHERHHSKRHKHHLKRRHRQQKRQAQ